MPFKVLARNPPRTAFHCSTSGSQGSHTMEGWRQSPVALYRRGAGSPPHHHPSTYPLPPTLHRECIQRLTMHSFQPHASLALTTPFSTTLGHALGPQTGAAHGDRALLNPKPLRGPGERAGATRLWIPQKTGSRYVGSVRGDRKTMEEARSARCPKEQIQRGHADVAERRTG